MSPTPPETIKVIPPLPGTCRICATAHDCNTPHDISSLYYRVKFRRQNGRYPTAEDAAQHCTEDGNGPE